jgi:hypothetical protein
LPAKQINVICKEKVAVLKDNNIRRHFLFTYNELSGKLRSDKILNFKTKFTNSTISAGFNHCAALSTK